MMKEKSDKWCRDKAKQLLSKPDFLHRLAKRKVIYASVDYDKLFALLTRCSSNLAEADAVYINNLIAGSLEHKGAELLYRSLTEATDRVEKA